ncbi:hypothetical protein [Dactylosporangium darangshiense]|uniref:hypothetical protein n=1 Tax=Dactylosporangium darangshiense TaxID=579108 RepID=UPI003645DF6A
MPAELLPAVREIALGEPGDPVRHGLFPSYPTKLARLALAAQGEYDAAVVLAAAERAYEPGRPYHAHDALACALVHPGIGAGERAGLVERYAGHGRNRRGWRSRKRRTASSFGAVGTVEACGGVARSARCGRWSSDGSSRT